ncbi:acetyltransferase [Nemania sp. FL0916]|nr:acetyltransferase [Nemania sp. FL0916]
MGTPFIKHQEPSSLIISWDCHLPYDKQLPHMPVTFKDAMSVREAVFVGEQNCPLEVEYDVDDARSCHWVMYASVKTTTVPEERDPETNVIIQPRQSETKSLPIGTIRIVPFPHPPHPPEGARYIGGILQPDGPGDSSKKDANIGANGANSGSFQSQIGDEKKPELSRNRSLSHADQKRLYETLPFGPDRPTDLHDGKEPYVKLSRVAVLSGFRGHQVSAKLWNVAKKWMVENPTYFNPSVAMLGMERMKAKTVDDIPRWNGLVCVHAQEQVAKIYERWGFKVDKGMGKFYEEGIPHVGMFQRLELPYGNTPIIR